MAEDFCWLSRLQRDANSAVYHIGASLQACWILKIGGVFGYTSESGCARIFILKL